MNGDEFRKLAATGVDSIAAFLDKFPELNTAIKIGGKFGTITINIDDGSDPTWNNQYEKYEQALLQIADDEEGHYDHREIAREVLGRNLVEDEDDNGTP